MCKQCYYKINAPKDNSQPRATGFTGQNIHGNDQQLPPFGCVRQEAWTLKDLEEHGEEREREAARKDHQPSGTCTCIYAEISCEYRARRGDVFSRLGVGFQV